MGRRPRFTVAQVRVALEKNGGLQNLAAASLECAPSTVTSYIQKHPTLRKALDNILEENLDIAEAELMKAIQDSAAPSHMTAVIFYLKTKGKHRGYVERYDVRTEDDTGKLVNMSLTELRRVAKGETPDAVIRSRDSAKAASRAKPN